MKKNATHQNKDESTLSFPNFLNKMQGLMPENRGECIASILSVAQPLLASSTIMNNIFLFTGEHNLQTGYAFDRNGEFSQNSKATVLRVAFGAVISEQLSQGTTDEETFKKRVLEETSKCLEEKFNIQRSESLSDDAETMTVINRIYDRISQALVRSVETIESLEDNTIDGTVHLSDHEFSPHNMRQLHHYLSKENGPDTLRISGEMNDARLFIDGRNRSALPWIVLNSENLETINASDTHITTAQMNFSKEQKFVSGRYSGKLKAIDLSNTGTTNEGAPYLTLLPTLENINLSNNADYTFHKKAAQNLLRNQHLNTLDISGTRIQEEGIVFLSKHPALEHLTVTNAQLTSRGVESLAKKGHQRTEGEKGLKSLDMRDVDIHDSKKKHTVDKATESLLQNRSLVTLEYKPDQVTPENRERLTAAIQRNQMIENISQTLYQPSLVEGSRLSDAENNFLDNIPENALKILENLVIQSDSRTRQEWKNDVDIQKVISVAIDCPESAKETLPRNVRPIIEHILQEQKAIILEQKQETTSNLALKEDQTGNPSVLIPSPGLQSRLNKIQSACLVSDDQEVNDQEVSNTDGVSSIIRPITATSVAPPSQGMGRGSDNRDATRQARKIRIGKERDRERKEARNPQGRDFFDAFEGDY